MPPYFSLCGDLTWTKSEACSSRDFTQLLYMGVSGVGFVSVPRKVPGA